MTINLNLSNAQILARADHLSQRGDALLHYLEKYCDFDNEEMAIIFHEAGLGFGSHRLNGDDGGYRAKLDYETMGHALSMADCITDRSERLELIEDALKSVEGQKVAPDFDKVVEYICSQRASRIALERDPEVYRASYDAMKRDLFEILKVKGMSTTLGPENIIRFFGMEEVTFRANFAKLADELRIENGIDGNVVPVTDETGDVLDVLYTFEIMC